MMPIPVAHALLSSNAVTDMGIAKLVQVSEESCMFGTVAQQQGSKALLPND